MAVTNTSDKEVTLKNMLTAMPSDNYTIDKTLLFGDYDDQSIISIGNILNNYRDYFESMLIEVDVPERFYYQPAAFSENYYGTPGLDFMVLYFARMSSMFEFTKPKIKVLPSNKLIEINRLFTEYKKTVDNSYDNPTEYIKEEI